MNNRLLFIFLCILTIGFARLLPHPANVTPVAAMALFGGAMFSNRIIALVVTFAAMLLSDMLLGFHSTMWAVYLSFGITVLIGSFIQNERSMVKTAAASIISSVLFFLVTNFAVWYSDVFYPQNFSGLMSSYVAGLPFFRNTLLGDLFFTAVLFGGYKIAVTRFPKLASA